MFPKISVITVVYNNHAHIAETICSVFSQTYSNIEYIIVDGASTDGTLNVINQFRNRIHHVVSEPDKGIYDALNKGLRIATGDVIGFLHSDDEFSSSTVLETIAQAFRAGDWDGVYSDLEYVKNKKVVRFWKSCPFQAPLLARGWMPPHPTLYLKREVYQEVGLFNLDYKIAADYDFILRTFNTLNYRFYYLSQVTVKMAWGGASNGTIKKIVQKSIEDVTIMRKNGLAAKRGLFLKNFSKLVQFLKKRAL